MTVSNKEEKPHSIRNETFQSGNTLNLVLPDPFSCYYANQRGILLLLGLSTIVDHLHMDDGLLHHLACQRSPTLRVLLWTLCCFCLFIEYQAWEGPKIPSKPMLPHFLEVVQ